MDRRTFAAGAALGLAGCAAGVAGEAPAPTPPDAAERARTIAALRPPKRARPVVAVLCSPHGSETVDVIAPYSVLHQSGLADIQVVSPTLASIPLMPALSISPQQTLASFDAAWPDGADYVIVPAMHSADDPEIVAWIRRQHEGGAFIAAICAGALVVSNAGLIQHRRATTHWYRVDELRRANPAMDWIRDRRYVVDEGVATTTGISAALPFSLAMVEAIGGAGAAERAAVQLGVESWDAGHDSGVFHLSGGMVWAAVRNRAAFWAQDRIGIPVREGVDELALALAADAYSETYRSSAFAIAEGAGPIRSRRGLDFVPTGSDHIDFITPMLASEAPARALDAALEDIASRYGRATAAFAALNMEYPWRG